MTENKAFKKAVRQRAAGTGEPYTQARRQMQSPAHQRPTRSRIELDDLLVDPGKLDVRELWRTRGLHELLSITWTRSEAMLLLQFATWETKRLLVHIQQRLIGFPWQTADESASPTVLHREISRNFAARRRPKISWNVDQAAFLSKLATLTPEAEYVIVTNLDTWHSAGCPGGHTVEAFGRYGIHVME